MGTRKSRSSETGSSHATIDPLVLEEYAGVVVANRGLEQALGVGGEGRAQHLEAGRVGEPRLGVLRVEGRRAHAASRRAAHDHRDRDAAPVVVLPRDVDELVEAVGDEVRVLHLRDGTQPLHRGAHGHAHDGLLADRRVHHALGAELLDEALRDLERAAVDADVLAEEIDALVALHLLPQRLGDRDQVGGLAGVGALAARLVAVAGGAGLDLGSCLRHQPVPPSRLGSPAQ